MFKAGYAHWFRFAIACIGFWLMLSRIPTHDELRSELKPFSSRLDGIEANVKAIDARLTSHMSGK